MMMKQWHCRRCLSLPLPLPPLSENEIEDDGEVVAAAARALYKGALIWPHLAAVTFLLDCTRRGCTRARPTRAVRQSGDFNAADSIHRGVRSFGRLNEQSVFQERTIACGEPESYMLGGGEGGRSSSGGRQAQLTPPELALPGRPTRCRQTAVLARAEIWTDCRRPSRSIRQVRQRTLCLFVSATATAAACVQSRERRRRGKQTTATAAATHKLMENRPH